MKGGGGRSEYNRIAEYLRPELQGRDLMVYDGGHYRLIYIERREGETPPEHWKVNGYIARLEGVFITNSGKVYDTYRA